MRKTKLYHKGRGFYTPKRLQAGTSWYSDSGPGSREEVDCSIPGLGFYKNQTKLSSTVNYLLLGFTGNSTLQSLPRLGASSTLVLKSFGAMSQCTVRTRNKIFLIRLLFTFFQRKIFLEIFKEFWLLPCFTNQKNDYGRD